MRSFMTRESQALYLELGSRAYGEFGGQESEDFVLMRIRQARVKVREQGAGSWRSYGKHYGHTVPRKDDPTVGWWEDYDYDPTWTKGESEHLEQLQDETETILTIALEWDMEPSEVAEMAQRGWINLDTWRRPVKRIHEVVEGQWEEENHGHGV